MLGNTEINQMCVYSTVQGRAAVQWGKKLLTHSRGAWSSNSVPITLGCSWSWVGVLCGKGGGDIQQYLLTTVNITF